MKVIIFLCSLALARAGTISTGYSPASVSTVYSSANTPLVKTYTPVVTKTFTAPAPVYESVATHETTNNIDGTQHTTFSKTLNTPFTSVNKFDSHTTHNGVYHSVPVYSSTPVFSQPHATYSIATPVVHTAPSGIAYTAHSAPVVTKTISTPTFASISHPVVTKTVSPGLTAYAPHPVAQPVKITYSEAPLVSHMSFTGLGTSYSW